MLRRVDAGDGTGAQSAQSAQSAKPPKSPKDAKAAKPGEEAPAAESTQVLRRIKDTDAPSATPGAQAPAAETTHVLGRVKDASAAAGLASPAAARAARAAAARSTRNTTGTPEHAPGQNPNANRNGNPNANASRNGNPADPAAPAPAPASAGGGKGPKKPKRRKRTGWRRIIPTWRMVLGTFVIGVMLVIGLFFLGYSLVKIPTANALATKQSNVYLYADGSQLARDTRDSQVNRENVGLAEISKDAQHAVLAAEDRDFYTESAVDPKAMLRAGWNTATGKGKQSGSTITQQYVKNYYLGQEQTLTRKAKEFFIAIKLDREKSKDEILEGYLNTSYFGRGAYGIQAAAQAYYGKDAADLDPARAAYLAALVNAPSEYDVIAHPENKAAAVARWNYVLDGMVKKNWLSPSQRAGMKFPMPKEQTLSTNLSGQRGYLVDAVKNYLISNKIVTADELEAGGYRITTTFQKDKQNAFVKAVDDQLMSKLDKKNNQADKYVRAGGASVDPKTGQVVAMYGGIDYVKQYTNGATREDFQVGSTFKPIVLASALQNGSTTQDGQTITPNTYYDGTNKRVVQGWSGTPYGPENEDQQSYGDITVRKATDLSVNAVYAQMAADVGPDKVKQTAVDLGIPADTQDLYPSPSIALGTNTAGVLHMAEAYATLANHGRHGTYTMVKKVTKEGSIVQLPQRTDKQAVSREAADTTTNVLKSVVDNGTATAAQAVGRPAAGKTGTAEEDKAAWFAGYTPDLATVVSVMGQDPVTAQHKSLYHVMGVPRMNGGGPPTQIWAQYTRAALKNKPVTDFDLQLQPGAEQTAPPTSQPPAQPGTAGQDNGGTTGTPSTGGTPSAPTTGGTPPANGGTTGGQDTTGGTTTGQGTTGGTTTGQGDAAGGTTQGNGNGGTTGGPTTGGDTTGGNLPSGGNTDAGNDTAGGQLPTG
ncbi:transglycosylase domain-containing protein [Streptomyces sp. L2]|uniref:transglycosylase domain-containing protein n=1 Tax=Streptomyces sp. L2 TaxID=2162665 RepID=UPI00240DEAD1|nr:transglycosylase domain-containing protein [Streptomyces sp. L2]